jgi:hypothetical protein
MDLDRQREDPSNQHLKQGHGATLKILEEKQEVQDIKWNKLGRRDPKKQSSVGTGLHH